MLVRAGSSPSPRRELSSSGQRLPVRLERVADDAVVPPALVRDDLARVRPSPRAKAHRCGMNATVWPFGDQAGLLSMHGADVSRRGRHVLSLVT